MSTEDSQQDQSMEEILQSIKRIISEDEPEGDDSAGDDAEENALSDDSHVVGSDILELTDMLDEDSSQPEDAEEIDIMSEIEQAENVEIQADQEEEDAAPDIMELVDEMTPEPDPLPETMDMAEEAIEPEETIFEIEEEASEIEQETILQEEIVDMEPEIEDSMDVIDDSPSDDLQEPEEEISDDALVAEDVADESADAFAELTNMVEKEIENSAIDQNISFRSGTTVEDLVVEALKPMLSDWLDDNLSQMVKRLVQREIERIAAKRLM